MNSARLRQRLSVVYASATRAGSRVFYASSAIRAFCAAVSAVKGGTATGLVVTLTRVAARSSRLPPSRGGFLLTFVLPSYPRETNREGGMIKRSVIEGRTVLVTP